MGDPYINKTINLPCLTFSSLHNWERASCLVFVLAIAFNWSWVHLPCYIQRGHPNFNVSKTILSQDCYWTWELYRWDPYECTLAMLEAYMLHHPLHFLGYKLSLILVDKHFFGPPPPTGSFVKPYIRSSGPNVQIPTAKTTLIAPSLVLQYIYVCNVYRRHSQNITN
jgi:hypothetical protein